MNVDPIATDRAPTPTGPFNQAIRVGDLVFVSGQAGRNRDTGAMGDAAEQADWALANIGEIVAAAGGRLADVVKTTLYVRDDVTDLTGLNDVWRRRFPDRLPARASVFVSRLKNPEMLVEVEAVAVVG